MRLAAIPWSSRYALAAIARRLPSARLYSSDPRSSQLPADADPEFWIGLQNRDLPIENLSVSRVDL